MACIRRLILDVLKPHKPNALDFSLALADLGDGIAVKLTVVEVDEKTESTVVVVEGNNIDYPALERGIREMGATIHSIDEVEVTSGSKADSAD